MRPRVSAGELIQALVEYLLVHNVVGAQLDAINSKLPTLMHGLDLNIGFFDAAAVRSSGSAPPPPAPSELFAAFGLRLVHGWTVPETVLEKEDWAMVSYMVDDDHDDDRDVPNAAACSEAPSLKGKEKSASPADKGKARSRSPDGTGSTPGDRADGHDGMVAGVDAMVNAMRKHPDYEAAADFVVSHAGGEERDLVRGFLYHPHSKGQLTASGLRHIAEELATPQLGSHGYGEFLVVFRASHFIVATLHPAYTAAREKSQFSFLLGSSEGGGAGGGDIAEAMALTASAPESSLTRGDGADESDESSPVVLALVTDQGYIPSGDRVVWEAIEIRPTSQAYNLGSTERGYYTSDGIPHDLVYAGQGDDALDGTVPSALPSSGLSNQDMELALKLQLEEHAHERQPKSRTSSHRKRSKGKPGADGKKKNCTLQ